MDGRYLAGFRIFAAEVRKVPPTGTSFHLALLPAFSRCVARADDREGEKRIRSTRPLLFALIVGNWKMGRGRARMAGVCRHI
jgi:hypothetical protein